MPECGCFVRKYSRKSFDAPFATAAEPAEPFRAWPSWHRVIPHLTPPPRLELHRWRTSSRYECGCAAGVFRERARAWQH